MMLRVLIASVLVISIAVASRGDESSANLAKIKVRVTGLFQPEREQDLREVMLLIPDARLLSIDYMNAEAMFEYDPQKSFNKATPDKFPERLDNAVRTNSHSTFGIKPASATPQDKLQQVEIGVLGLDCKGCALGAYESVARLDGVVQATVNFKEGLVTAKFDPEKTNRDALVAALERARVELKKPAEKQ